MLCKPPPVEDRLVYRLTAPPAWAVCVCGSPSGVDIYWAGLLSECLLLLVCRCCSLSQQHSPLLSPYPPPSALSSPGLDTPGAGAAGGGEGRGVANCIFLSVWDSQKAWSVVYSVSCTDPGTPHAKVTTSRYSHGMCTLTVTYPHPAVMYKGIITRFNSTNSWYGCKD